MQRFGETPECSPRGSRASGRPASSCLPPAVGSHEEHCLPSRALAVTPRTKARSSPRGSPAGTGLGGAPPGLSELWEQVLCFQDCLLPQPHPSTDSTFHPCIPHT